MKMLWVSRLAYEMLEKRLEESETERKRLLDQVLTMGGLSPVHNPVAVAEIAADPQELSKAIDHQTGLLSPSKIAAMATAAKQREYQERKLSYGR